MSYMEEYLRKGLNPSQLEDELINLINEYDELTGKHLFLYSVDLNTPDVPTSISIDDLYTIKDILRNDKSEKLSFYIETPGGSGVAAEEIAQFLRNKYDYVDFIIVGECKSAGTILAMCGDEIYLNDTGSLGPIDAQIQIGRSYGSAHDYMKWVEDKIDESNKNGQLNNFDALMVAQITPNELVGVQHSLDYGKELVTKFLRKYKFKNWKVTETKGKPVDDNLRQKRAEEIADKLADHSQWKTHGRSLKIDTLCNDIKLKVKNLTKTPEVCELVERIQVLLRLIFSSSSTYKIMADKNTKLVKNARKIPYNDFEELNSLNLDLTCNNCGKEFKYYINLSDNPLIDMELQNQGRTPLPEKDIIICECGFELNLKEIKNNIFNKI
ncbi:ATP-dependent Clp protease proteolytic subunit [uncultured Methanobrevibacter sp.]|uniref:SDH family Clp fold serine proteinase n=1 Tax=uncultured Methanobrevibacter sp. TaxID=253161 RepID=UPI0025D986F5|nr:ATP-dependent Clp protease proteolytic subunit [uncultured Methanobrevibacter sp.]